MAQESKELEEFHVEGASDERSRTFIKYIRKYLRENAEDLEKNQQVIGMRYPFRGFSTKA